MSPQVKNSIEEGTRWKHSLVPNIVVIPACSIQLVCDMLPILINCMPDCLDKKRLEAAGKTAASNLSKVINKTRMSCYGWKLVFS